jgi:hypothetical protein
MSKETNNVASKNLSTAKEIFLNNDYSIVLVKDDSVITSQLGGISPLMKFAKEKTDLRGFAVADRVVGKAAALLYKFLGIKEVYADVISVAGLKVCNDNGIDIEYRELADVIKNKKGDDICPMEKTVADIDDPDIAFRELQNTIAKLMQMQK